MEVINISYRKVNKENSFAKWFIDKFGIDDFNNVIIHEKNIKNGINIWEISKRSAVKLWFRCKDKYYHEYELTADKYYKGNRCKYCGRTKYIHPLDSFGQYIIDNYGIEFLNKIWSDKNENSPFEYTLGTEKKAHFNCCECGEYIGKSQIKNYIVSSKKCPKCRGAISSLHEKVIEYLNENNYSINTEHDCSIIPINPITNYPLPYDIEVIDYKLIIEVNGKQHYSLIGGKSKWLKNMTPEEYLKRRKERDEYKKAFAIANGFFYLEIPYWTEKDENYKTLIQNKLNKINIYNTPTTTDARRAV